ncbi:hypothetical protein BGZ93_000381, partial [Podila epicladia]
MASNSVAAAAWSGSQTLYVQYRNPRDRFGTLLAIDTSPAKSPSPSPPTPSTSPFETPTIPSNGGSNSKNSLLYEVQPVSSFLANPVGVPMSLSMVSVSSMTTPGRDLLLAYNQLTFSPPVLLRYTPSSASGGQAWTASSATLAPSPAGTEAICLAPGGTTSSGDGSSFFQLAILTQLQQLRKVDAQGSVVGAGAPIYLDASRITPQLVALTDPGANVDTVIIGECPMLS